MYLHNISADSNYCLPQNTFSEEVRSLRKEGTDDESTDHKVMAVDHSIVEAEDCPQFNKFCIKFFLQK